MGLVEIFLIGIALSMDAVAVTMSNSMVYKEMDKGKVIAMPVLFGLFQGVMPLIGYFAGGIFKDVMSRYAGVLVFLILGCIGGKMLKDAFSHGKEAEEEDETEEGDMKKQLTYKTLLIQAVATSIDAFAVGVGFSAMGVNIFAATTSITLITAMCCGLAILLGKKCGDVLGNKSEIIGGSILVLIALKALL
ncbi:MAG: manganese efflux pump MntP family protein [Cellulosilyticaceae bacterium]